MEGREGAVDKGKADDKRRKRSIGKVKMIMMMLKE